MEIFIPAIALFMIVFLIIFVECLLDKKNENTIKNRRNN